MFFVVVFPLLFFFFPLFYLPSTSLWGVYSHNMHPSSTIMQAVTLIAVYFPEAIVHVLNHITSTQYSFIFIYLKKK